MTSANGGRDGDEQPIETAMRQFKALRHREQANMLNQTKIRRLARETGLDELATAVEERRYYELVDRYRAECGSGDEGGD